MLGVVLWSNPKEGKAVVWCEDQGDLAYVKPGGLGPDPLTIEAGDLVEIDLSTETASRCVQSARLIERQAYPSIADKLLAPTRSAPSSIGSAEIIKFTRPAARTTSASCKTARPGLAAS